MNSTAMDTIKALIEHKKYSAITEYANILHKKDNLIVTEYGGTDVRLYKDKDKVRLLCPKKMDTVMEGHVAAAIENGSVFDDADIIDTNATCIERLSIPYDAMINSGKDTPNNLKPMIAIVIGKMNNDGSFDVSDDARNTGTNFVHDLSDAKKNGEKINGVVNNYIEREPDGFYTPEMGKNITGLNREMDDINDTDPGDVVSDDDTVDSYDGIDVDDVEPEDEEPVDDEEIDDVELGNEEEEPEEEGDELPADEGEVADNDVPSEETENEDEESTEEEPEEVEECGENCNSGNKPVIQEEDEYVEESLKVSRDDMRGEFMQKNPDGTYHSGNGKPKEKKPALKITGDKISVKSGDLKEIMKGDFIRCVDKDGNIKMIKITVGKSLIDKNDKVIININDDSARITLPPEDSKEKKAPTKKKVVKKTPFGPIETWVYEYANGEVFDEAVFVQEEADDVVDSTEDAGATEQMGEDTGDAEAVEETDVPTKAPTETGTKPADQAPLTASTKTFIDNKIHQEGFFSKKPKKLKPINRDVVAYITVEMNAIHSANDQAMLAGYTCSKIELVDWYITVIDTQDPKYLVPHTRQYLVTMKAQLESLLAQILKIRPINRSEQIWRVNYPQAT